MFISWASKRVLCGGFFWIWQDLCNPERMQHNKSKTLVGNLLQENCDWGKREIVQQDNNEPKQTFIPLDKFLWKMFLSEVTKNLRYKARQEKQNKKQKKK